MGGLTGIGLVIVVVVLASLAGLTLVRRLAPRDQFEQHTEVAGYVYAVIGVIYAVILAQVVIAAWEEYRDARSVASAEADAVLNLARLAQGWSPADRDRVEEMLTAYALHVVDIEWPAMARGDYQPATHTPYVHQLWQAVDAAGQHARIDGQPRFAASLQQLDGLDAARRSRVLLGAGGLPLAMTLTLVLGAIVTVGFSYLFAVENGWVHGLMTASLAMLVALLLLLEYQLETPFEGISAIEPTAMEFVIAEIDSGVKWDVVSP